MPIADGAGLTFPPGFCHFGRFLDENYFKQITSEYLEDGVFRGRKRKTWKQRPHRDNHFLDCRVGNIAGAHAYFTSFKADDWAARAKERGTVIEEPAAAAAPASAGEQKNYFEQLAALNKGL
jgi:phage terminase large subunit GpA-like protein